MAKINFDTAKRLDITTRLGDSFELELTLKDSSGIAINLFAGAAASSYSFKMLIQKDMGSTVQNFAQVGYTLQGSPASITVTLTDDIDTTTADTSDANYIASTAATGKVKFSLSATDMQGGALQLTSGYLYDIQYVNPEALIPALPAASDDSTERTILWGSFNFIKDISI